MPDYQHHWKDGTPVHLPLGKIVCIGRNYAEHARELNNLPFWATAWRWT